MLSTIQHVTPYFGRGIITDKTTLEDVLTHVEAHNKEKYERLIGSGFALQLHQNPDAVPTNNANMGDNLQTMIKNCWPCWSQVRLFVSYRL